MMNVTFQMSDIPFSSVEDGEKRNYLVIPQMVSTLRKNLFFEGEHKFVKKQGTDPSPKPSMDEMNGKSFIRPTEH